MASDDEEGAREGQRALAKAQAKLAEFDAIAAIFDPYQRANPKLTVEEVIPLLLRDGRAEDAKRVQQYTGRMICVPKPTL